MSFFRKRAVAVVVIHEHGNGRKDIRVAVAAIVPGAAPDIIPVPDDVAQHDQVEETVAIEIDPRGRSGPSAAADARLGGDIGESAITVVVIEVIAAEASDIEVLVAVVVVVPDG